MHGQVAITALSENDVAFDVNILGRSAIWTRRAAVRHPRKILLSQHAVLVTIKTLEQSSRRLEFVPRDLAILIRIFSPQDFFKTDSRPTGRLCPSGTDEQDHHGPCAPMTSHLFLACLARF